MKTKEKYLKEIISRTKDTGMSFIPDFISSADRYYDQLENLKDSGGTDEGKVLISDIQRNVGEAIVGTAILALDDSRNNEANINEIIDSLIKDYTPRTGRKPRTRSRIKELVVETTFVK